MTTVKVVALDTDLKMRLRYRLQLLPLRRKLYPNSERKLRKFRGGHFRPPFLENGSTDLDATQQQYSTRVHQSSALDIGSSDDTAYEQLRLENVEKSQNRRFWQDSNPRNSETGWNIDKLYSLC